MFSGQIISFDRLLKLFKEYLLWIYTNFMQMLREENDLDVAILQTEMDIYISHVVLFENSNLQVQRNDTLNLECKEVRDQFLENLDFSIHFYYQNYMSMNSSMNVANFQLDFQESPSFNLIMVQNFSNRC